MKPIITDTVTVREKLHHFIDEVEDEKIFALYTLFGNKMNDKNLEDYPEEWKQELDSLSV